MLEILDDGPEALRLVGELDVATAPELQVHLQGRSGVTVVDLRDVTFIDSSGLRVLLVHAGAEEGRRPLVLRAPSAQVRRVLELAGLAGHFGIEPG